MAQTVWAGSRERFLFLFGNGLTGTGSGSCWAKTVQRGSREIFLVLFGNGKQEQDLIKMYLFINFGGKLTWKKIQINDIMDIYMLDYGLTNCRR